MNNSSESGGRIGYLAVVAIGIGGMVGGGIFAVLGLAVSLTGGGAPIAFALSGLVASLTAYSYARLSVRYPSEGGTVTFLNQAFGTGRITGSLNVLLWLSYLVTLALYSFACGSYGATFFPAEQQLFWKHFIITASIVGFTLINAMGATFVGRAEKAIVAIKLAILLFVGIAGVWFIDTARLSVTTWARPVSLIAGGMIIFVAYEGFELIANTAQDVRDPRRTLPRAYYSAVGFVIALYLLIAAVTVGNLPLAKIAASQDYALAAAARPFLGHSGFVLVALSALLATCSAINATLYGSARVSYIIAKDGELPAQLDKTRGTNPMPLEGLIITCVLSLLMANFFRIDRISTMGSAGFLLIFAMVNLANVVLRRQTESGRLISTLGFAVCLVALGALIWQTVLTAPRNILVLVFLVVGSVLIEVIYRAFTGREIRLAHGKARPPREA
jgi:amino acid transporter